MTMITIPTAAELAGRLGGLDRLLTARSWERAAIVWAFTTADGGRPAKLTDNRQFPCSITEFVKLNFKGLTNRETVSLYRQRWQEAIDSGDACSVTPGDEVELPDLTWPPNPNPSLRTDGTEYEDSDERAADIVRLVDESDGRAKGAIRVATSSPETLRVVAQTATSEQAQALAEGLRRRGIDQSESYVQSLHGDEEFVPPARPEMTPETRERIEHTKNEINDYYQNIRNFIDAGRYATEASVASRELAQSLARTLERGGELSEDERHSIMDSIRNAQKHLADSIALLNTKTSVSDAAADYLKNIG